MSGTTSGGDSTSEESGSSFPVVGLGASAGGIKALQAFFGAMPADSGFAFVVVMHLSPDHESSLAQVLQQRTTMPVVQVSKRIRIQPNHVYVIPPNKHLSMEDSTLVLVDPQQSPGRRVAIDLFFRTLAAAHGRRALCIVLSGSDSDGVIGLKHIKEQGGVTIAQDPLEAEYDSMPRSAIATGMVDWVLPADQIPARLLQFMRNEQQMHVPPEVPWDGRTPEAEDGNSGGPLAIQQVPSEIDELALREVLRFLHGQTGHDFSHYKRATVLRRVARRLQVNLFEDLPTYLDFLRTHSAEAIALLHDLLISVTNFFRDPDAFASLESHVPQLFAGRATTEQVRVWVTGCATGEEAYSVAMLLHEHAARLDAPPSIQVFASDIDEDVIQVARAGLYPMTIEADVSQDRLKRFFQRDLGRYRIKKELRETVLFSVHDLLRDSPFSRLDMITCRNLLIYLKREAQERVFDTFHYALRSGGLLFLGGSEGLDDLHALFTSLDKRHRIFVRRAAARPAWQIPSLPISSKPEYTPSPRVSARMSMVNRGVPSMPDPASLLSGPERRTLHFGELHQLLLEEYAPPSVLIDERHFIIHLSDNAGQFLQLAGGEPTMNVLKVVHPALRLELRSALFRAVQSGTTVATPPVRVELNGTPRLVEMHVHPVLKANVAEGFLLVVFENQTDSPEMQCEPDNSQQPMDRHLEEEIQHVKEQLRTTVEQYEISLEEQKASNEEQQAINEELRSTSEELETSKEELQSVNEELTTVNQELKSSVEELSRANSDLQNLMASTKIGTIFLNRELRVMRFTPSVQEVFNLIPGDIGRPLTDITNKLDYPALTADAERVLKEQRGNECEIRSDGRWFLGRILPYRTLDDHIDGVVVTFVDITTRKQAEEARVLLDREVAILAERNRLAHELHDTLAQGFTAIKLQMDAAEDALEEDPSAASRHIVRARDVAQQSMMEARRSIHALHSSVVEDISLGAALTRLARQASNGVKVETVIRGTPCTLTIEVETDLYRIGQEALANALHHGRPTRVEIELNYLPTQVRLRVHDDGKGFDTLQHGDGIGIAGMYERAARLGAALAIVSQPGQGADITVELDVESKSVAS